MHLFAPNPGTTKIALDHQFSAKLLLGPTQLKLFQGLVAMSQGFCVVLCKVRLSDFLQHHDAKGGVVLGKHSVDFLLCRNEDMMPMLAVEVAEANCPSMERRDRDTLINMAFGLAAIPIIRVPAAEVANHAELGQLLGVAWKKRQENLAVLPEKGLLARKTLLDARDAHAQSLAR